MECSGCAAGPPRGESFPAAINQSTAGRVAECIVASAVGVCCACVRTETEAGKELGSSGFRAPLFPNFQAAP